jgi:hypothetical protein
MTVSWSHTTTHKRRRKMTIIQHAFSAKTWDLLGYYPAYRDHNSLCNNPKERNLIYFAAEAWNHCEDLFYSLKSEEGCIKCLFHLGLSCTVVVWTCVMCGFCNVWVCVCVDFVTCGCSDNCVSVLVIRILVFIVFCIVCTVFLYCFVYVYLFLFVLSVLV